jgi:RNA ligase (TIGR02306 family)
LLHRLPRLGNIAIQAELVGPGIQKNPLGLQGVDIRVFNVYYIDERRYGNYAELVKVCNDLGLPMVELVYKGTFAWNTDEDLRHLAEGVVYKTGKPAEGVVIRPTTEMRISNERVSCKIINLLYKER